MERRPIAITIVGCIFVATGVIGSAWHATEMKGAVSAQHDALWAILVSLVAVVCGIYLLRRSDWARWLALAWLVFHVILSLHSARELLVHSALLALFAYLLFRPQAGVYFRAGRASAP